MNKVLFGLLLISSVFSASGNCVTNTLAPIAVTKTKHHIAGRYSTFEDDWKPVQSDKFKGDCAAYGFTIDSQWYPYHRETFFANSFTRKDQGKVQYQTDVQHVLLQNAHNNNVFSVVYRVVTSPVARRYFGFIGVGSHSDTWYTKEVKTTVDLGTAMTIGQWAPKNTDSALSGSIGIEFGSDGVSISASVNLNISQLHFVSRTNVATGHYETDYTISGQTDYNLYSAEYKGCFTFIRKNPTVSLNLGIEYTVAYNGSCYFGLETNTYKETMNVLW